MSERCEFEQWESWANDGNYCVQRDIYGKYVNASVEHDWLLWQVARASPHVRDRIPTGGPMPTPPEPQTLLDIMQGGIEHLPESLFQWMHAVDDELVSAHLGTASFDDTYEEARRKLTQLIAWHVAVALDPAVNGGFELVPMKQPPTMLTTTLEPHMRDRIRGIFLANGFTIKEGETDLKPHVYQAARALLWAAGVK